MTVERIFERGIQIANDVVAFERHRFYLSWSDASNTESIWHIRTGHFDMLRRDTEVKHLRKLFLRCEKKGSPFQSTLKQQKALVATFRAGVESRGAIVLMRDNPFTNHERWVVDILAKLMESAIMRPDCADMFDRLYLMFLHARTLSNTSSSESILDSYVYKAGFVCHPEFYDPFVTSRTAHRVRIAAKLNTENNTSMRIVAYDARPKKSDWTKKRINTPYDIVTDDSIASRVHNTRRPYHTNAYRSDKLANKLFASDPDSSFHTQSHISAPFLLTTMLDQGLLAISDCLGVLSIETSAKRFYDDESVWSLSLLAAHCAHPLASALIREEAIRKQHEASSVIATVEKLRECGDIDEILTTVDEALAELRYQRTLFCEVDQEAEMVYGIRARGRLFNNLKDDTKRYFGDDAGDCQVLAAITGERQVILRPRTDPRTNRAASELADLKPFGVFPFVDKHGHTRWTVHVERSDLSPLGEMDYALVGQLTSASMDAWERVRLSQIEAEWAGVVFQNLFGTTDDLIRSFADFVTAKGLVSRCRVYDTSDSRQIGLHQSGVGEVADFINFILNERCQSMLSSLLAHRKSTLFTRSYTRSKRHYGVYVAWEHVATVPHLRRLRKERVPEWIEVPVIIEGEVAYKLSFDHWGANCGEFSFGELRVIASLTRLLNATAEMVAASELPQQLAREGLHAHILRHGMLDVINQILYHPDNGLTPNDVLKNARITLGKIKALAKRNGESTIGEDVEFVVRMLKRWLGTISVEVPSNGRDICLVQKKSPFAWILLTLFTNAIKAINAKAPAKPAITLDIRQPKGYLSIVQVRDNGAGVPAQMATRLRGNPKKVPSETGEGIGLAYAQLLAAEHGWELKLVRRGSPTVFQIEIPLPSK